MVANDYFSAKFTWSSLLSLIIVYLVQAEQTGPCGGEKKAMGAVINQYPRCNLRCLECREGFWSIMALVVYCHSDMSCIRKGLVGA